MTLRGVALVMAVLVGLLQLLGPGAGVAGLSLTSKESSPVGWQFLPVEKSPKRVTNKTLVPRFNDLKKRRRNTLSIIHRDKHDCLCQLLVRYERNNCCRRRARCC